MNRFSRISNDPALDFIATDSGRRDTIWTYQGLVEWLVEAGMLTTAEVPGIFAQATGADIMGFLGLAHALRIAMRSVLEAYIAGRELPANDLAIINEHLKRVPVHYEILVTAGRLTSARRVDPERMCDLLYFVAEAARELFTGKDPRGIRRCASAECPRYFYDASPNRTRRWCSMAACGNREKVAALRRRRGSAERSAC